MILSIVMSLLKNMSSSTGFTKKAVAELATAITNIHAIARKSLSLFSLISASKRLCLSFNFSLNMSVFIRFYPWSLLSLVASGAAEGG
jgi:hypothetical protein